MKTRITAKSPTSYQYRSLSAFGMPIKELGNGSYIATKEFHTKKEAIEYLKKRAEMYYEDQRELKEALQDVKCGVLTLDAVTAGIEPINDKL